MPCVEKAKESFKTGLVVILPLFVTIVIIRFMANYVFLFVNPIVKSANLAAYTGNITIIAQVIAILLVVVFITLLGYISDHKASEKISLMINDLIKEIPVFGSLYSTIDKISESLSGDDDKFQKAVLVDFPDSDLRSLGLLTSEAPEAVEESSGEEMHSVYVPQAPNAAIGHLTMLREDQFTELDMSVQEAMKLVITTGIATEEEEIETDLTQQLKELKEELSD